MNQEMKNERCWLTFKNTGINKDTIEDMKTSFHAAAYKIAVRNLEDIINRNFTEKDISKYNNPANIMAFIGKRGSGKSSVMMSFMDALKHYRQRRERGNMPELFDDFLKDRNVIFTCLECIDGSLLEAGEDIFSIVLAQIYQKIIDVEENNGLYQRDDHNYRRREVLKRLEDIYKTVRDIEMMNNTDAPRNSSISYLSNLESLSSSQKVKREFQKLIEEFTELMVYRREGFVEYSKEHYVVIAVDDIDLNVHNGFSMLEKIHRYLMVKNVIVILALDYQQMQNLAIRNYYDMYPQVDAVLRAGVPYAGKIATDYLDKVLPINYRIYLDEISSQYIEPHVGIMHEEEGIKKSVLRKIYHRTGICFDSQGLKQHFYQPDSFRQLNNFYLMLENMESIRPEDLYLSKSEETGDRTFREKVDGNWNYMLQDLMNRMALSKSKIYQETLEISGPEKEAVSLFSDKRQFLSQLAAVSPRRARNQVIFFSEDIFSQLYSTDESKKMSAVMDDFADELSYGSLVERIYHLGRVNNKQYKGLVHCLLAFFSYEFTRDYLQGFREKTGVKQSTAIFCRTYDWVGRCAVEDWANEMLPEIRINVDYALGIEKEGEVLDSGDAVHVGHMENMLLIRIFGFHLRKFDLHDISSVANFIYDLEVLYTLLTDFKNSYYPAGKIDDAIYVEIIQRQKGNAQISVSLDKSKVADSRTFNKEGIFVSNEIVDRNPATRSTCLFNVLNCLVNTSNIVERLTAFEETMIDGFAKYRGEQEGSESAEKVMLKKEMSRISLIRKYEKWEETYGKGAFPFPLYWFDMSYNILKRTRRNAVERMQRTVPRNRLEELYDNIRLIYQDMGEQLKAQCDYYKSEGYSYDFAEQFMTHPVVQYFTEQDLSRQSKRDRMQSVNKRRNFWAQFFLRVLSDEEK